MQRTYAVLSDCAILPCVKHTSFLYMEPTKLIVWIISSQKYTRFACDMLVQVQTELRTAEMLGLEVGDVLFPLYHGMKNGLFMMALEVQ